MTGKSARHSPEAAQALMEVVLKPLLRLFSDQVEGCREQAVAMVTEYVSKQVTCSLICAAFPNTCGIGKILKNVV